MDDTPNDTAAGQPANSPANERLMLDFSQRAADAFTQLFEHYRQPVFGFFRRRVAIPRRRKN